MDLLVDRDTYRPLTSYATNKQENRLIYMLMTIKVEGGLEDNTYARLYQTRGPQISIAYP